MPGNIPDFDYLVTLATNSPHELEELRIKLCDHVIESAPISQRRRLRGLQFQIDMERRKAATPMAACMRISEMMHSSFDELRQKLNEATGTEASTSATQGAKRANTHSHDTRAAARVLSFPER
ncbi:MAG: DUF3135 domain-containing protein [Gammaproteobacteria bacterium]|nr:DUF3135 domain-containing protein [Gammaproteobacteria bacterium]